MISQVSEETKKESGKGRIAIYLPSSLTKSFEIVLGRVADLIEQGDNPELIHCAGKVSGCVANPYGIKSVCRHCVSVTDTAVKKLFPKIKSVPIDGFYNRHADADEICLHTNALKAIESSVNSTILTFYRTDASLPYRNCLKRLAYNKLHEKYTKYNLFVLVSVSRYLSDKNCTRIEFFNGRIIPSHALLIAAESSSIDYSVIEVAGVEKKILTVENELIHDFFYRQRALRSFIKQGKCDLDIGEDFYKKRRSGEATDTVSFVNGQKRGLIVDSHSKPIISIFTSSTDEFSFLGEQWFTPASKDPVSFITILADLVSDRYQLIVRMHPNQAGDKTGAAEIMEKDLRSCKDITLITPSDPQSTYELIDISKAVLCFGSSIGLEATYSGKPSILAGRAVWDFLDVSYYVESPEQVKEMLTQGIQPKPKDDAIKVASYYMIGDGQSGALEWSAAAQKFYVNGQNFLKNKRSSISYFLTRLIDKGLRAL